MEYAEHKITLDIHQVVSPKAVNVKMGDTAHRLIIYLTEHGHPYHISDECYAVFTAEKPDGNKIFNPCTLENCAVVYDVTAQTVAVAGAVNCEIQIYGANDALLTSASFIILVHEKIYNAGDVVESEKETEMIAQLISDVADLQGRVGEIEEYGTGNSSGSIIVDDDGYLTTTAGGFEIDEDGYIVL